MIHSKDSNYRMKIKYIPLLMLAILLSSCAGNAPVSAPVQESTKVPDTPSNTPVTPTLTFTPTPPLIGFKTWTPTPTITPTQPTATQFDLPTLDLDTPTPPVEMKGFVSVNVSLSEFYKKPECEPSSVKFTAQVANPTNAAFVLLSVRFKSKQTGTTSKWTSITMDKLGIGTFTYDLIADNMIGVDLFENAWVQYQFVSTDSNSNEIGRTGVFSEKLTLLECLPTPTPEPTQTPLRP